MYIERIERWVRQHRRQILDLNKALVSIPSINRYPDGDEADVQRYIGSVLERLNCQVDVFEPTAVSGIEQHPAYLGGRSYQGRPNVVGTRKGSGQGRSIIFSGHADTVPLGDAPWTMDPFSGQVKDGKQYGLGIFDMKGGMAAAMSALQALEDLDIRLQGDVLIESVVDEEYGGANGTLACRLRGYEADIAIVPEPTNMIVCPENQGGAMYRITYNGRSGRGFSGETLLNPVFAGARFLGLFRSYQDYHASKPRPPSFRNGPGLPAYIQGLKAGEAHLPLFDRSPGSCVIDVWIQCYPGTTEEELYRDFVGFYERNAEQDPILQSMPATFERLIRFLPGTGIGEGHDSVNVIERSFRSLKLEGFTVQGAPFACDSFMFNLHSGTPALIWGPKGGNAHAPDEFIDVEDFMTLVQLYAVTMVEWCGISAESDRAG